MAKATRPAPVKMAPLSPATDQNAEVLIPVAGYNLFGKRFTDGVLAAVSKADKTPSADSKTVRRGTVIYPHPVAIDSIYGLKDISGHHCSCIQAKKYVTVGLGFIDDSEEITKATTDEEAIDKVKTLLSGKGSISSKVDDALDPFTNFGFMNELLAAAEDFMDVGTGYLEVCRDKRKNISGITQIPARDLHFCTYNGRIYFQYSAPNGYTRYFALFGLANKAWLLSDKGPFNRNGIKSLKEEDVSEIIPFIQPSNRVKYYGYPDWISASVDIDLLKKSKQYKADFYHNRGVIDKILTVTGQQLDEAQWKQIKEAIRSSIGAGNNFRSIALNLANENAKIKVQNLGAEGGDEDQFAKDNETLTQNIVSSHRVPPLLANILIPGKLGANNEFINALIAFQLLVVNPYQNVFEKMLAKTLGGDDGVDGLKPDDFRLRTITSQIDLTSMDTASRMRSEVTDPANKNRDLSKGVKK